MNTMKFKTKSGLTVTMKIDPRMQDIDYQQKDVGPKVLNRRLTLLKAAKMGLIRA